MYIKEIKLVNYRNFDNFSMEFDKGLNVIIGSNNSGKTNLLKAINLLNNPDELDVDDFNKTDLFKNYSSKYLNSAPEIFIEYTINHKIDSNNHEDESIIKLLAFLGLDKVQRVKVNSDSHSKYFVTANIIMRYSINEKYIEKYKDLVKDSSNGHDYIENLRLCKSLYEWTYGNGISDTMATKNDVINIFKIDYIGAERKSSIIEDKAKNEIKSFTNQENNKANLKQLRNKISGLVKVELKEITDKIDGLIGNENNEIGLAKGNISIFQGVKAGSSLTEAYSIEIKDTISEYVVPLTHNGVGYNNLVYMYMLIKLIELSEDNDFRILCLEEPEAHLHPAMQYKLFSFLSKLNRENNLNHQIFVSTHSSNISAVAGLENMYLLHYLRNCNNHCVVSASLKKQFECDKNSKNHLAKFLDVTRSDMLFADKVIFVEGIAEKLLLPEFMKKENYPYEDNHVSIVEIGGKHFKYFLRTFIDNDINRKALCITDNDFKWFEEIEESDKKTVIKLKKLNTYDCTPLTKRKLKARPEHTQEFHDKENIRYDVQRFYGSTFEDELFIENFDNRCVSCELLRIALPKGLHDFMDTLCCKKEDILNVETWKNNLSSINANTRKKVEKLINPFIQAIKEDKDNIEQYNKLFFAKLFLEYAKNQKGDVALNILVNERLVSLLKVPTYIKEGIEWLSK